MTTATKTPPQMISLKALCGELKIDPRDAREKLRAGVVDAKQFPALAKARKPRTPWEWPKGSDAEKKARAVLTA